MHIGYYERYMLSNGENTPTLQKSKTCNLFLDSYVLKFLDTPKIGNERDFQTFANLRRFYKNYPRNCYLKNAF